MREMDCGNLQGIISTLQWLKLSETGKLIAKYVSPEGMSESEIKEIIAKGEEEGFILNDAGNGISVPLCAHCSSYPMYYCRKFDIEDDIARLKSYLTEM